MALMSVFTAPILNLVEILVSYPDFPATVWLLKLA